MSKIYSRIESIVGSVITVKADNVAYGELAEIETVFGKSLAEVNKIDGDTVSLQVFAGGRGVSTGDHIRFLGHRMEVSFSENLLGRIFNGSAEPRDNGPALTDNLVAIGGPSVNPAKRIMAKRMIRTGIPMIDMFNTLVISQKLPIFSISGEPYNQLLARIAMQAEVDVIVLGGMGLKYDDYLYFKDTLENGGALSQTVMFMHTAADPTVECQKIPDLSLAVAEQFALQGKDVLVLLTDMTDKTIVCHGSSSMKCERCVWTDSGSSAPISQAGSAPDSDETHTHSDTLLRSFSHPEITLRSQTSQLH